MRIFLSYAHEDQAAAKRIVAALASEGIQAWWDHDIPPGSTWDEVIGARITAADIVIVLWSRRSVISNFVKEEAQLALDAGKMLPLRVDPVEPPIGFRRVQAANLSDWRGEPGHGQWRVVLDEIQRRLGDAPTPRKERRAGPAPLLVGAAFAVLAIVGGGLYVAATMTRELSAKSEVAAGGGDGLPESREPPESQVAAAPPRAAAAVQPPAPEVRPAAESVAQTVWQGAVYRQSGRSSQWAIRFNENGTAAIDFMDGRGFIDTGDWSWTQDGRAVRFTHATSGNRGEGTIHGGEMSGTLTMANAAEDSGSFRFVKR